MELRASACVFRVFMQGFASAEATRGLCGRPLDCFACPSKLLDFYRCFLVSVPFVPQATTKPRNINPKSGGAEGFQRAIAVFVCFHALWSPPQRRFPLLHEKSSRTDATCEGNLAKGTPSLYSGFLAAICHRCSSGDGCVSAFVPNTRTSTKPIDCKSATSFSA